eukprot:scaffold270507_cov31-Tisochrysis_lutea.AAC.2
MGAGLSSAKRSAAENTTCEIGAIPWSEPQSSEIDEGFSQAAHADTLIRARMKWAHSPGGQEFHCPRKYVPSAARRPWCKLLLAQLALPPSQETRERMGKVVGTKEGRQLQLF